MELFEINETFSELVNATSNYFGISDSLIEKDYFSTRLLKRASILIPGLIFKGGTSLSKAYKLINRFSEDIDLTLDLLHFSQSCKRQSIKTLINICGEVPFTLLNKETLINHSHGNYNIFIVNYPCSTDRFIAKPQIILEMVFFTKCYPSNNLYVNSYIGEFVRHIGRTDLENKYDLAPFLIQVQSALRTFVDKVFAICDYFLSGSSLRNSRHLYDITCLLKYISFNYELKEMIDSVRLERQRDKKCLSSMPGISINQILKEIVESKFYKDDFENVTTFLLFDKIDYKTCENSLIIIINSNVFS